MTAKEFVIKHYPQAYVDQKLVAWRFGVKLGSATIYSGKDYFKRPLGFGDTERKAWVDAKKNIAEQTKTT